MKTVSIKGGGCLLSIVTLPFIILAVPLVYVYEKL